LFCYNPFGQINIRIFFVMRLTLGTNHSRLSLINYPPARAFNSSNNIGRNFITAIVIKTVPKNRVISRNEQNLVSIVTNGCIFDISTTNNKKQLIFSTF